MEAATINRAQRGRLCIVCSVPAGVVMFSIVKAGLAVFIVPGAMLVPMNRTFTGILAVIARRLFDENVPEKTGINRPLGSVAQQQRCLNKHYPHAHASFMPALFTRLFCSQRTRKKPRPAGPSVGPQCGLIPCGQVLTAADSPIWSQLPGRETALGSGHTGYSQPER